MQLRVVRAFLRQARSPMLLKLAISITQEIIELCQSLKETEENASLLEKEASFLLEKLQKTDDLDTIKRLMQNFRDQVALRADMIKEQAVTAAEREALYRLDMFLYKTQ